MNIKHCAVSLWEKNGKISNIGSGAICILGKHFIQSLKAQDLYQCKLVNKSWNHFLEVKYEDKFYNYMYELKRPWIEATCCKDEETKFLKGISIDSNDLLSEGECFFQRRYVYIAENKLKN